MTSICVWRRSLPSQLVILLGDFEAFGRVFDLLSTTTSYSPKGWLNRVITGNNHSPDWHMQLPLDTASFAADPSAKVTENRKTGQIFAKTAKKSTRFVEKRSETMNLRISITDAADLCQKSLENCTFLMIWGDRQRLPWWPLWYVTLLSQRWWRLRYYAGRQAQQNRIVNTIEHIIPMNI